MTSWKATQFVMAKKYQFSMNVKLLSSLACDQYDLLCSQVDKLPACLPARTEQNRKPITRVPFKVEISVLLFELSHIINFRVSTSHQWIVQQGKKKSTQPQEHASTPTHTTQTFKMAKSCSTQSNFLHWPCTDWKNSHLIKLTKRSRGT